MALKVGIVTEAFPAGTNPYTDEVPFPVDAGFSQDVKLVFIAGGRCTTLNATNAQANTGFGFIASNNNGTNYKTGHASIYNARAVTLSDVTSNNNSSEGPIPDSPVVAYNLAYTGFRLGLNTWGTASITWNQTTTQTSGRYLSHLHLGGDIEVDVVVVQFNGSETQHTTAHNLSGAPEVIICLSNIPSSMPDGNTVMSYGFWANGSQVCAGMSFTNAEDVSTVGQSSGGRVSDAYIAMGVSSVTGDVTTGFSINSVSASNVVMNASQTSNHDILLLLLRGTTAPITAKVGVHTAATGTGDANLGANLGVAAQVLMMVPTRVPAVNTSYDKADGDQAGFLGIQTSCNRSGTPTTQYGGATQSSDPGATTTVTNTWHTDAAALMVRTPSNGADAAATVSNWGSVSTDVVLNYSDGAAAAYKIPYLVFGTAAAGGIMHRGFQDMSGNLRG